MKSFSEIVKPALILTVICLIISLALAGTNVMTKDSIAKNNEKQAYETRVKVLPEADGFEKVDLEAFQMEDESASFVEMYRATNDSGYVATVETKGYGGKMVVMVGFYPGGKYRGVSVLSSSETPGLGKKAEEPSFLSQYADKGGTFTVVKNSASSPNEIVAVSGATISSRAVTNSVNCAYEALERMQ